MPTNDIKLLRDEINQLWITIDDNHTVYTGDIQELTQRLDTLWTYASTIETNLNTLKQHILDLASDTADTRQRLKRLETRTYGS